MSEATGAAEGAEGAPEAAAPAGPILALDTATSRVVVAFGRADRTVLFEDSWTAGHRHGETLLPEASRRCWVVPWLRIADVAAIVVGTGPGTFTGLRVGLASGWRRRASP